MRTLLAASIASVALLAGCGKPAGSPTPDAPAEAESAFRWPDGDMLKVGSKFGATQETPSGLRWQQLSPGTGDAHPAPGDTVSAHYRGTFLDGTVFD